MLTRRIAQSLFYEHGLRKGDTVLLISPNCVEFTLVLLGALTIGVVVSTANPLYTISESDRFVVLCMFIF